ncbi:major capsid protein [uncultured Caudovirales phage]|uniref:Major capsid protein n=1 Tax=uncultured Caudovirales phage TaxID=2100421 RepID=A0A6J5P0L0_9CAUD|nr:major capsid protein [uncultured Caudovirales phage]
MANFTVDRIGQIAGAGVTDALFLKQFGGEIMGIFQNQMVGIDRHTVRNISSGKTAQFPAYGRVTAAYHTPGTELVGQTMQHAERTISVDDFLVADLSLSQIDDLMNHYDVRGPYAEELAYSLANAADANVLQVALLAARASATVTGGAAGKVITSATANSSASALITALYTIAQTFDENNLPAEGRQVFIKPAQWSLLAQSSTLYVNQNSATPGDVAKGTPTPMVAGIELVKTNNVPSTNVTTGPTAYRGNFSTSVVVATHKSALGTVKLLDLTPEITWQARYLVWLITARFAMGHGILRPESAAEVKTS